MTPKRSLLLLPLSFSLLLVGCFPIELDVNEKGEMLIYRQEGFFIFQPKTGKIAPVAGPGGGLPVFGRFSPNGRQILLVVRDVHGRDDFRFDIASLDGDKIRTVFRTRDAGYALFSPNGSKLAITRRSDKHQPQREKREDQIRQKSAELVLVQLNDGTNHVVAEHVAGVFRWYRDGQRILIFKVEEVDEGRFYGHLAELVISNGQIRPLASVVASNSMMIDLSSDNTKIIFTAHAAGVVKEKLDVGRFPPQYLFEWHSKTREVRRVDEVGEDIVFARYSPSARKVLFAKRSPEAFDQLDLCVADERWKEVNLINRGVSDGGAGGAAGGQAIPGWIDEETVFFFVERFVYGFGGKSLTLMTANNDGTEQKNVQPFFDREAYKAEWQLPNQAPPEMPRQEPKEEIDDRPPVPTNDGNNKIILAAGFLLATFVLISVIILICCVKAKRRQRELEVEDDYDDY